MEQYKNTRKAGLSVNGTIVGCGFDNKVNDDMSGKLQQQNAHEPSC